MRISRPRILFIVMRLGNTTMCMFTNLWIYNYTVQQSQLLPTACEKVYISRDFSRIDALCSVRSVFCVLRQANGLFGVPCVTTQSSSYPTLFQIQEFKN